MYTSETMQVMPLALANQLPLLNLKTSESACV